MFTIVGGRNIGDAYFDAGSDVHFRDLDVLAIGPVVAVATQTSATAATTSTMRVRSTRTPSAVAEASPRKAISAFLIQDENGQPFTYWMLRNRFDEAREAAGATFQFRDIRAKAATDTGDLGHAQKLLGHANRDMTEHYTRDRKGERIKPLR